MSLNPTIKSKILGQYFTPPYIVNYIIDQTVGQKLRFSKFDGQLPSYTILEPACGNGIFLVNALKVIFNHFKKYYRSKELIKLKRSIIANNLYGIDIDDESIKNTKRNLGCESFTANFKVFDALLPPPNFDHQFYVSEIEKLRKQYKTMFIENNDPIEEKILQEIIYEYEERLKVDLSKKVIKKFNLSDDSEFKPMLWETIFPETKGKFDIIVGNPPWGNDLTLYSSELLRQFKVGKLQVDSWSLFLEKSLNGLKDGGYIGFILPNTLLMNENYTRTRQLILESCRILNIINLGDNVFPNVTQPCMIIIAEKVELNPAHQIDIIQQISEQTKNDLRHANGKLSLLSTVECTQTRFINNPDFQFDIFTIGYEELKNIIEKDLQFEEYLVKPLGDLVTNARGVELNKNGKVIKCSSCGWWNSPPVRSNKNYGMKTKNCINSQCQGEITEYDQTDFIVFNEPKQNNHYKPFLVGEDIQRYLITRTRYIDSTRKGLNYKQPDLYQGPKLLLRKTGFGIKTAIDYEDRWVNQVVYLFKLKKNSPVTLEYLLGLINSKLISKYFYLKYADPCRGEFPHFTQRKFLRLPIKIPKTKKELNLAKLIADRAALLQLKYQKNYSLPEDSKAKEELDFQISNLDQEIDEFVFKIYQLTPKQINLVYSNFYGS
ncbi:MAG: Eco57I restriction-modification methylase domain-containing protein [Candidatus Hodarchaeota archaeon]